MYNSKIIITALMVFLIFAASSCTRGHPMPMSKEIYEAKSPHSGQPVVQIIAEKWTDNEYQSTPVVKFMDSYGDSWAIACYDNDPNHWCVYYTPRDKTTDISRYRERLPYPYHDTVILDHHKVPQTYSGDNKMNRYIFEEQ